MGMKLARHRLKKTSSDPQFPKNRPSGLAKNAPTVLGQYLKDINHIGLLSKKEEIELTTRIDGHIRSCIANLLALISSCVYLLKKSQERPLPQRTKEIVFFRTHSQVKAIMNTHDLTGDDGLRETARRLVRKFNPEGLAGQELKETLRKTVRSERCAELLSTFVSPAAKRDFDMMIKKNLRLVVSMSRKFHGLPQEDLVQEGNLALMTAVARYDVSRGFRFSTYAGWWIRHYMDRAISNTSRTIRIPVHVEDMQRKISQTSRKLTRTLRREPTAEEIAKKLDVPVEKVVLRRADPRNKVSLNSPSRESKEGPGLRLIDILRIPEKEDPPTRYLVLNQEVSLLEKALEALHPMEQDILRKRFGFGGTDALTLKEVGAGYGLSRERIRQIQATALKRLKKKLENVL